MKIGNLEVYGVIYKITNKANNKCYIGQTINGFKRRYSAEGRGIKRVYNCLLRDKKRGKGQYNEHLYRAIEKYGLDSFEVIEVFDVAFSEAELNIKERAYIELYKCVENGYNNNYGGDAIAKEIKVVCLNNGDVLFMSEACDKYNVHKSMMVNSCKGKIDRILYLDEKLKFVYLEDYINLTEEDIGLLLYKTTDEYLSKKISDAHLGVQANENHPLAKKIICLNTLEVFETIKEAMEKYKTTNLYGHLRRPNRYKSAGKDKDGNKLIWAYYDDYIKNKKIN